MTIEIILIAIGGLGMIGIYINTQIQLNKAREDLALKNQMIESHAMTIETLEHACDSNVATIRQLEQQRDKLLKQLHDIGAAKADMGKSVQLFCTTCKIGVGDTTDFIGGHLKECPKCKGTEFAHSWEFEL